MASRIVAPVPAVLLALPLAFGCPGPGAPSGTLVRDSAAARYVNEPPAAFQLKSDRGGNAWVGHFRPVWPPHSTDWTVVSTDGRLLGRVTLPENFTALDIGENHVTGRIEDELGVHFLAVYALDRGGGAP